MTTADQLPERQLAHLLEQAEVTHSDAVAILHHGESSVWRFGKAKQLIETMSVTKSIVNLAVGKLSTLELIESVDTPVHHFYPEWKQGRKAAVTLRHLMDHTSGLQNAPNATVEIYPSPDFVQLALCAELDHDPGTHFAYNNKAVNLIAGVIERASGFKLDTFMAEEIFAPLDILDYRWMQDAAGNPHAMSGLSLFPEDLAKLGHLLVTRGTWKGTSLIKADWFERSLIPSFASVKSGRLLWWLVHDVSLSISPGHLDALARAGVSSELIEKLQTTLGSYHSEVDYVYAMQKALGNDWREVLRNLPVSYVEKQDGGLLGYRAEGWLGQCLYVFPEQALVVVRLISELSVKDEERDSFMAFDRLVLELARAVGTGVSPD